MLPGIDGSLSNQSITACLSTFAELTLSESTEHTTSTSSSGALLEEEKQPLSPRVERSVSVSVQITFETASQRLSEGCTRLENKPHPIIKATLPKSPYIANDRLAFHDKYSLCDEVAEADVLNVIGWKKGDNVSLVWRRANWQVERLKKSTQVIVKVRREGSALYYLGLLVQRDPRGFIVQYTNTHFENDTKCMLAFSKVYALQEVNRPSTTFLLSEKERGAHAPKSSRIKWSDERKVRIIRQNDDRWDVDTRAQDSLYSFLLGYNACHSDVYRYTNIKHKKASPITICRLLDMRKKNDEELVASYFDHCKLLKDESLSNGQKEELRTDEKLYLKELARRGLDALIDVHLANVI